MDTFFSQYLLGKCYKSLWKVFVLIFYLFHGQAAIETNNDCSVINQSKESLIALRIAKDHLNAKNVTAANNPITRKMISKKKKEENQSKVNFKRKIVLNEITNVQKEKALLQESSNGLVKDADKVAFEAETKNDFKFLGRSNDLRKINRTKKKS